MKYLILAILALLLTFPLVHAEQKTISYTQMNVIHTRALILKNEGRYDEAERLFKSILVVEPNNPNAHFDLANTYLFQNKFEDALNHYKEAKRLGLEGKHMADYHFNISMCYAGAENNKEAINSIEQCLKINPDYPEAENLLELYKEGGKFKIEPVD